jgi:hypothetical protein
MSEDKVQAFKHMPTPKNKELISFTQALTFFHNVPNNAFVTEP